MKNYRKYSDQEIIESVRSGDEKGYKAIFHNRTGALKKFVRANGGDDMDADNIEQKTVLILYEKIISGTFKLHLNTRLSTFLYSIGRNLWLKEIKKREKTVSKPEEHLLYVSSIESHDSDDPLHDVHKRILSELLNRLDDDCQKILVGKFYENRSDEEISKSMGTISTENVRKRRYKCIQKLKKQFFERLRQNG